MASKESFAGQRPKQEQFGFGWRKQFNSIMNFTSSKGRRFPHKRWQKSKSGLLTASEQSRYKAEITAGLQRAALPSNGLTLSHTPNRSHNHTTVLHTTIHQPASLRSLLWPSYWSQHNWRDADPGQAAPTAARSYQKQTTPANNVRPS